MMVCHPPPESPVIRQAVSIDVGVVVQIVQASAHFQVEQPQLIGTHQVQMRTIPMRVFRLVQLPTPKPLDIQRQDPAFGVIDAALLLVLGRLAQQRLMPVHVQNGRDLALQVVRLIQNRDGIEPGNDFVPQLAQFVAVAGLDHSDLFELGRGVDPLGRPTVKDNIAKRMLANPVGLRRPSLTALRVGRRSDAAQNVLANLKRGNCRRQIFAAQNGVQRLRLGLSER